MLLIFRRIQIAVGAVLAALAFSSIPALAQGTVGPGGINIGFDFNWGGSPPGYTASFINTGGTTVNNCSGGAAVNSTTSACSFAFTYSVGGTAQTPILPGGSYETWMGANGQAGRFCDETSGLNNNTAPLTLFNCFNQNSFGQLFAPSSSGALSGITMNMTCLNPAGTKLTGLTAVIYQLTNSGRNLPAAPLAQVPVDLSSCPTLTNWNGHTFSAGDFATIPLNFTGVTVTAGSVYGVFFSGLVPGQQPPGSTQPQTISFTSNPPPGATVGGTYAVTATGGGSGNPVTFSIDSGSTAGACSITGANVSFTGTGTCIVDANQAAGGTYTAAPQVQQSITVSVAPPPTSIPILTKWALALLTMLLGGAGWWWAGRRNTARS